MVFAIILASDLRASRRGEPPDLLTSALSSARPEVRYAAARALELRADPEAYQAHLVEALLPPKPEKAGDMKEWPAEDERARRMVGLAEALASDVLRAALRRRPGAATCATSRWTTSARPQKVARPRSLEQPWKPETTPEASARAEKPAKSWLRRLFSSGKECRALSRGARVRRAAAPAPAGLRRLRGPAAAGVRWG